MKRPQDNYEDMPKMKLISILRSRDDAMHRLAESGMHDRITLHAMQKRLKLIDKNRRMFDRARVG